MKPFFMCRVVFTDLKFWIEVFKGSLIVHGRFLRDRY